MTSESEKEQQGLVNLLQEAGMLASIPRSGFAFLGTGNQSIAEHSFRMTIIALFLVRMSSEDLDELRTLHLCLFHDYPEARIGDHNYVQKKYIRADLETVFKDIEESSKEGSFIVDLIKEFEEQKTPESIIAKEADHLELLLILKQEWDTGNPKAEEWFNISEERLKTQQAKELAKAIRKTPYDAWWRILFSPVLPGK